MGRKLKINMKRGGVFWCLKLALKVCFNKTVVTSRGRLFHMAIVHGEMVCSCNVCIRHGHLYFSSPYKWSTSSFHEYIFFNISFSNIMLPILKNTNTSESL